MIGSMTRPNRSGDHPKPNMGLTSWRGAKPRKQDGFLSLNDRNILEHAGKISHQMAKEPAERE